jgi:undecaprenyl-diphosphatase
VPLHLTFFRAIVIGLLQGVTELFPISSLGHSVLLPGLFGWKGIVDAQSAGESPYLAFLVGLHVATALALLVYYREQWLRIIPAFFRSIFRRKVETKDEKLAWMLVLATIPTGVIGLAFEHTLRTIFAKPVAAASFLTVNGVILLVGEQVRRRSAERVAARTPAAAGSASAGLSDSADHEAVTQRSDDALAKLTLKDAGVIGLAQVAALFAGISRSGITMVAGLVRGLDHEDAARFAFLMATPIILAAGVYKLPDLAGHLGDGIRGQVLAGSAVAAVAAYGAVAFLERYFTSRNLNPFAIYCLVVGPACIIRFGLF